MPRSRRQLHAACPRCRDPLTPELVALDAASMASCSRCGTDLRDACSGSEERYSRVLEWERRLYGVVTRTDRLLR